ncbi:MAG: DUF5710 domain-containing protein [Gammaproteobacteria bacterium]
MTKLPPRRRRYFPPPDELSDLELCMQLGAHYDDEADQLYIEDEADPLDFVSFFPNGEVPAVTDLAISGRDQNLISVVFDWFSPRPKPDRSKYIESIRTPNRKQRRKKPMSNRKIYLDCPYSDKDECKALGGRWDPEMRKWYVPAGTDPAPFSIWMVSKER